MPRSPDETDAFVGARMAGRRQALGLTQVALARRLGISAQQVQKYETGTNRISASRLSRIAAALGDHPGAYFPPHPAAYFPPMTEDGAREETGAQSGLSVARFLTATTEGRVVAESFPLIRDRAVRQAIARVVEALSAPT